MSEHRVSCMNQHDQEESVHLSDDEEDGLLYIRTPTPWNNTYWTREQAARLRDVLTRLR